MKYGKLTWGQMEAIINMLGGEDGAMRLLRGELEVVERKHVIDYVIDCDAPPFVLEGWEVVEHRRHGKFVWNPDRVELYICDEQRAGSIKGDELREKFEGWPVMNANVLDYLLRHPELIPEEWKGKYIFFWGTIYRDSDGKLLVRCLEWGSDRGRWSCYSRWLDRPWRVCYPAVFVSSK